MKLDTASLKPRICAICKRDLAEIASPNDCEYCVLYQTVRFCPGKRLSKRALSDMGKINNLHPLITSFKRRGLNYKM